MKSSIITLFTVFLLNSFLSGQVPEKPNTAEIYNQLQKLNFLGTALYFAAHPDDENTRLISYLSNELHARTAYLSLTRGDGGQNLIGTEIREKLGLIRTHELLGARSVDGGEQYFSRANDFGYSKHPDETLAIWNKDEVMHDIIKVIREFKPDVIINRFDHRTPGGTHGHHTSSAMLSVEAFDLAGDPNYLKERLPELEPWQPQRTFFNTSWWFYGSQDKFKSADKSNMIAVDAGVYYPNIGLSNTEMGALSRSMHKSQGFGSTGTRGSEMEYLELVKGDLPPDKDNLFSGINTSWSRVEGGGAIGAQIDKIIESFNFVDPSVHTDDLIDVYQAIEKISDEHWKSIKLKSLSEILLSINGIFLESTSAMPYATKGETVEVTIEAINRSKNKVSLDGINLSNGSSVAPKTSLEYNTKTNTEIDVLIDETASYTNPYWLNQQGSLGMYAVSDEAMIGQPESEANLTSKINLTINGLNLTIERDVVYKKNDPVDGEVYAPFAIVPKASISFSNPVYIFSDRTEKEIKVTVKSYVDTLIGSIALMHPASWIVSPEAQVVRIYGNGAEEQFTFKVKGPYLQESATMWLEMGLVDETFIGDEIIEISYDHIPKQYMLSKAEAKFERISLEKKGENIAYIEGAGDEIPQSLREIGYNVNVLNVPDLTTENLAQYDALIVGIRAYNTKPELLLKKEVLNQYMSDGGTVIVQYNTTRQGIKGDDIAPYPMTISRDRVTDETAAMSFVDPEHEVLNYPNKITNRDFEKWVQERGLYFPNSWSEEYSTPLASSDKGEPLTKGGLLIAPVGSGYFIYTGISWFRELPAGVPGAYRLFANLISIGKNGIEAQPSKKIIEDGGK